MTSTLRTLLDRVEQGEGADREIDALLEVAFDLRPSCYVGDKGKLIAHRDGYVQVGKGGPSWCSPVYTSSIDAATYLVEKVLPGWDHEVFRDRGAKLVTVDITKPIGGGASSGYLGQHADEPRATILALLRAKIAQEGEQ